MPNFTAIVIYYYILYITIHNHTNVINFGIFGGSCTHIPWLIATKFGTQEYTHALCLQSKFHLNQFFVSPHMGVKTQILQYFQLQHTVLVPSSSTEPKLNATA